ncbi:Fe2+/Zn2+ uptake regulation protein [Mycobacterium alsense]|uniref:Fe2+/Zn2+ uptake regulation protein n=1 Tax=Mycobacterium alsense TaxID=324058 RepID=A0AA41XNA9_9MYCO|nr:transcriptional repressor [Mycobacterium alsense]MCV7378362.1 transcriptional repressor [Mycobacterium alsense]OQZ90168.1 Fe2+/Zn2+ uptake regulation protein [Mycobacterium alsense]
MSSLSESPRRRSTAKQRAVLEVLREQQNFRSAQQLYLDVRQKRQLRIGLTSVYRILRTLADDRIAETQRAEDGEILYRLRTGTGHRHYLVCRRCGAAVGFTPVEVEEHTHLLSRQHHYTDVTHYVDLYGICPLCRAAPGSERSAGRPHPAALHSDERRAP